MFRNIQWLKAGLLKWPKLEYETQVFFHLNIGRVLLVVWNQVFICNLNIFGGHLLGVALRIYIIAMSQIHYSTFGSTAFFSFQRPCHNSKCKTISLNPWALTSVLCISLKVVHQNIYLWQFHGFLRCITIWKFPAACTLFCHRNNLQLCEMIIMARLIQPYSLAEDKARSYYTSGK